jgi:hypothetical protein
MYKNNYNYDIRKKIKMMQNKAMSHYASQEVGPEDMVGGANFIMGGANYMNMMGGANYMMGGAMLSKLRAEVGEGLGKGAKLYKKQDEAEYTGGSGYAEGTFRDTGFEKVKGAEGDLEGAGFISDLGIPIVSGLAGLFGLGKPEELEGGMIRREPIYNPQVNKEQPLEQFAKAIRTQPEQKVVEKSVMKSSTLSGFGKRDNTFLMKLKQKKLDGKKFTKAEVARLEKMKPRLEGTGFWSDFADGFMSVVKPVASVAKTITGLIPHPGAQVASGVLSALGAGKNKLFLDKMEAKYKGGRKFTKAEAKKLQMMKNKGMLQGAGFWSDFADGFMSVVKPVASVAKTITGLIPHPGAQVASGVLSALGAGKKRGRPSKMKGGMKNQENEPHPAVKQIMKTGENADKVLDGGAKKKMTPYMQLIMKVKKDKNLSLKDAMKYVKDNNMYKK